MTNVTSIDARRTRRAVFNILGCERSMTLSEIVFAADQHFGLELDRLEVKQAIDDLQDLGHPIRRHIGALADEYQLIPGWGGGSAA